eukprot:scaffold8099_cov162-Amphora_coffeaeformis.AAC.1
MSDGGCPSHISFQRTSHNKPPPSPPSSSSSLVYAWMGKKNITPATSRFDIIIYSRKYDVCKNRARDSALFCKSRVRDTAVFATTQNRIAVLNNNNNNMFTRSSIVRALARRSFATRSLSVAAATRSTLAASWSGTALATAAVGVTALVWSQNDDRITSCEALPVYGKPGTNQERTFLAVKPDGVQRGLVGDIIARFEKRGYKLVGLKM